MNAKPPTSSTARCPRRGISLRAAALVAAAAVILGALSPVPAHAIESATVAADTAAPSQAVVAQQQPTSNSRSTNYQYLPMIRWSGSADFIRADKDIRFWEIGEQVGSGLTSFTDSISQMLFKVSSAIWSLLATINEWSSSTTLKTRLLDPINRGFATVANFLVQTGLIFAVAGVALIAAVISLLRMKLGDTLRRLFKLVVIGGVFVYLTFGSYAGYNDKNGVYTSGSPAWFAATALETIEAPIRATPFDLFDSSWQLTGNPYSCQAYMAYLYNVATSGRSPVDSTAVAFSRMWERTWYAHYAAAQFGDYEVGQAAGCRVLEALAHSDSNDGPGVVQTQYNLQAAAANKIAGVAKPVRPELFLYPDGSHTTSVRNFQARQLLMWASCADGTPWKMHQSATSCDEVLGFAGGASPGFDQARMTLQDQMDALNASWGSIGTFDGELDSKWNADKIRERAEAKQATGDETHIHNVLSKAENSSQTVAAVMSILNAGVIAVAYGGLLIGVAFSTALVLIGFMLLPIILVVGMFPGGGGQVAKRGVAFLAGAIATKTIVTILLLLHLTIVLIILDSAEALGASQTALSFLPGAIVLATSFVLKKVGGKLGLATAFDMNPVKSAAWGATAPAAIAANRGPLANSVANDLAEKTQQYFSKLRREERKRVSKSQSRGGAKPNLEAQAQSRFAEVATIGSRRSAAKLELNLDAEHLSAGPRMGRTAPGPTTERTSGDATLHARAAARRFHDELVGKEIAPVLQRRISEGVEHGWLDNLTDRVRIEGDRLRVDGDASHPANLLPSSVLAGADPSQYNQRIYSALALSENDPMLRWRKTKDKSGKDIMKPYFIGDALDHLTPDSAAAVAAGDPSAAEYTKKIYPDADLYNEFCNLERKETEHREAASQPQSGTQASRQQMIPDDALSAGSQRIRESRTATQTAVAGTPADEQQVRQHMSQQSKNLSLRDTPGRRGVDQPEAGSAHPGRRGVDQPEAGSARPGSFDTTGRTGSPERTSVKEVPNTTARAQDLAAARQAAAEAAQRQRAEAAGPADASPEPSKEDGPDTPPHTPL